MAICRFCGAEVSSEKAWCPNCNQPLEAEDKRTVEREMDSFAGTLIDKPKPISAARKVASVAPTPPSPQLTAQANPVKQSAVPPPPVKQPKAQPITVDTVSSESGKSGRTWIYLLAGVLVGIVLLAILAVAAAALWYYFE